MEGGQWTLGSAVDNWGVDTGQWTLGSAVDNWGVDTWRVDTGHRTPRARATDTW